MLIKAKISSVTDDTNQKKFSGIGRADEELNNRSYFQHVGFSSIPKENAVGILFEEDGTYTMVATTDTSSDRPVLSNAGDVVIYADADKYIRILADGSIEITNDNGSIVLEINGQVNLNGGNLTVDP